MLPVSLLSWCDASPHYRNIYCHSPAFFIIWEQHCARLCCTSHDSKQINTRFYERETDFVGVCFFNFRISVHGGPSKEEEEEEEAASCFHPIPFSFQSKPWCLFHIRTPCCLHLLKEFSFIWYHVVIQTLSNCLVGKENAFYKSKHNRVAFTLHGERHFGEDRIVMFDGHHAAHVHDVCIASITTGKQS